MKKITLFILFLVGFSIQSYCATTLIAIRNMYSGTPMTLPANTVIEGMVISDLTGGNVVGQNVYLQDLTGGLCVRFIAPHTFTVGSTLTVDVSGLTLTDYNDLVEVDSVPLANATVAGTVTISPAVVTIADIINNMSGNTDSWESTLVTIQNVTISGPNGIYQGQDTITDATGSMILFTRTAAVFAPDALPTGTVNITGIINDYQSLPELTIRQSADVTTINGITDNLNSSNSYVVAGPVVHGIITFKSLNAFIHKTAYRLTDISGKICSNGLLHFNSGNGLASLPVTNIKPGIYFLLLEANEKSLQIKILIN